MADPSYFAQDPFHKTLRPLLEHEISQMAEFVLSGGCGTYDMYREKISYINALRNVLVTCEDVEKQLFGIKSDENEFGSS